MTSTITPEQDLHLRIIALETRLKELDAPPSNTLRGALYDTIRGLMGSKKVMVALSTVVVLATQKMGVHISSETSLEIVGLAGAVILGFASSDFGKEAKKAS